MKLESSSAVILNSSSENHNYKIEANRKMFEILSSKIYKYKIAAIVRELSCNAYDSHIEAGMEHIPFEVTLPSDLYPYLEIRDFGVGLNEEQVIQIYTAYGASTKTNTNNLTGAFGLGSKTPFSYTTSFNIITVKDNKEYVFNAYMDENGPSISKISEKHTELPNGVTVKIPVSEVDFYQFKYEAEFILSLFPTRPTVVSVNDFEFSFTEDDIEILNKYGRVYTLNYGTTFSSLYTEKFFAIMGNVAYGFKVTDTDLTDEEVQLFKKFYASRKILLKFDIGELGITVSRESLDFEDSTKTAHLLGNKIRDFKDDFVKTVQKEIDDCSSSIEARKILVKEDLIMYKNLFLFKGKPIISNKEIKLPYKITTFSRSGWGTIKRDAPITVDKITSNSIVVIYPEKSKVGHISYCEDKVRYDRGTTVVFVHDKLSDAKKERLEKLLLPRHVDVYVRQKPVKGLRTGPGKGVKRKPTKITVPHMYVRENENSVLIASKEHGEIDLKSDNAVVLYFDGYGTRFPEYSINGYSPDDLKIISKEIGKDLIIFKKGKTVEKKTHANNVEELNTFIRKITKSNKFKRYLAELAFLENIVDNYTGEVKSPAVKFTLNHINKLVEKYKNSNILRFTRSSDLVTMNKDSKHYHKLRNSHKRLVNRNKRTYPLINNLHSNVDEEHVKEYIEMVDFFNANNGEK